MFKRLETDGKSCLDFQLSRHLPNFGAGDNWQLEPVSMSGCLNLTKVLLCKFLPDKVHFQFKLPINLSRYVDMI